MMFNTIFNNISVISWWSILLVEIFSDGSHLERRARLAETTMKRNRLRIITVKFGLIWLSGSKEEDLNVKIFNVRWMVKAHMAFGQVT